MKIGCIKEVKDNENRVGLTPAGVEELVKNDHEVFIQSKAGIGARFKDEDYKTRGATIKKTPEEVCSNSEILIKVKEIIPKEYLLLELLKGKTIFTYFHLAAADKKLTEKLLEHEITAIAYETVKDKRGRLPLLEPLSDVAGGLAVQFGAQYLQLKYGGKGKSLTSIVGVPPANVVIIGGGIVGSTAAKKSAGLGANVLLFDKSKEVIKELEKSMPSKVTVLYPTRDELKKSVKNADLLIGSVLIPGAEAPKIVTEEMVESMESGSVIVDVAIDQGGCVWGAKPTSHTKPIYKLGGKIYCCITNMPGQVAPDSTKALTNATFPYLLKMADDGVVEAIKEDDGLAKGVNTYNGKLSCEEVAKALELEHTSLKTLI